MERRPDWGGVGALRLDRPNDCALGASVWELQPDGENWYHLHHDSEEMVVVLRGTPTLRTPGGERVLAEGDVIVFPRGSDADPDVTEYPDTGKVGHVVGGELRVHRAADAVKHAGAE